MSESKSLLARLLAKENISVQHGNYRTAYFDVKNRVLGLPLWKDDNKDLYDMLVGHEVGHALFTPAEGWADAQTTEVVTRVPGDYLNIVEDIRIERLIQETYPGMVRSFKGGYNHLYDSDFFEIKGRNINGLKLMDRINLKAKLRDLIDVEFSLEEQPLVDKAFAAKTWDEVVEAARELYDWVKSQPPEESDKANNTQKSDEGDQTGEEEEDPTSGEEDSEDPEQDPTPSSSEEGDGPDEEDRDNNETKESTGSEEPPEDKSDEEVETYRNAMKNSEELLDTDINGNLPIVINGAHRWQMMERIVPFERVSASRQKIKDDRCARIEEAYNDPQSIYSERDRRDDYKRMDTDDAYKEFLTETKRFVNVMVKEFETRKAAYQYSKASVSRSGALDLDKLHSYKTSADIFRRVTHLADSKSHGMVMLIDNSASMSNCRGAVISQVLNLAMFCKRVNIPFDVYSFTNGHVNEHDLTHEGRQERLNYMENRPMEDLNHTSFHLVHVLSSSFSKKNYDKAYRELFDLSIDAPYSEGEYDRMSGTPLNDVLSGMHLILKDFKRKHGIQKPIFTLLTDGDSNGLSIKGDLIKLAQSESRSGIKMKVAESNKTYSIRKGKVRTAIATSVTRSLLDIIRKEVPGLTTLGYFVANDNDDFKIAVNRATGFDPDALRLARKDVRQKKFVSYDNVLGYDRYFILRSEKKDSLEAKDDEFKVPTKAKRNEIRNAFKKYAKSKKGNRVLATQFAEVVS